MPRPTYITLVNLTTAQSARLPRIGAAQAAIEAAAAETLRALGGNAIPIDVPIPGMALSATGNGAAFVATLLHLGRPVITWGVARRATAGPRLWSIMSDQHPTQAERPAWPWAAYYGYGAAFDPHAMAWMIDYIRCGAWGWIEGGSAGG